MKESFTQRQILNYLAYRPGKFWRQNTGAAVTVYKGKRSFTRFGLPGSADISGLRDGRRIEIEVKAPKGRQTIYQEQFQKMIEENGGLYVLARSLEDVQKAGL